MSKAFDITTSFFYRWRYWIGHSVIFITLASLLLVAGFLIPGELSAGELRSFTQASELSLGGIFQADLVNAPFYLLQKVSLALFGVSLLGIKLPSLLLGIATALCMILLLKRWFSPTVAILASMIVVTTGQFLFVAQNGSVGILYLFWPTALLLLATLVANRTKFHGLWKILFFAAAALSLYTPLSSYVLLSMLSAVALHPHLRHIVRRLPKWRMALGGGIGLLLLVPLILSIVRDPAVGLRLLGIPTEWPSLLTNLQVLAGQYFGFTSLGDRSELLPIFGFASMLLIIYGLVRLIRTHATVQSHVVLAWVILLLPILVINPSYVSIMFVPLFLLLSSGLEGILQRWYKLFPKNPYARVVGLIPLVILVSSMVLFGLERYAYAYRYAPDILSNNFTRSILELPETPLVVATPEEESLYRAVASYRENTMEVTTTQPSTGSYVVTAAAYDDTTIPSSVITSNRSNNSALFYVYQAE